MKFLAVGLAALCASAVAQVRARREVLNGRVEFRYRFPLVTRAISTPFLTLVACRTPPRAGWRMPSAPTPTPRAS